jgi:repressor of nif and glnA expression
MSPSLLAHECGGIFPLTTVNAIELDDLVLLESTSLDKLEVTRTVVLLMTIPGCH